MLIILYLRFSRPRADDEEGHVEESSKKGGRLLPLLLGAIVLIGMKYEL